MSIILNTNSLSININRSNICSNLICSEITLNNTNSSYLCRIIVFNSISSIYNLIWRICNIDHRISMVNNNLIRCISFHLIIWPINITNLYDILSFFWECKTACPSIAILFPVIQLLLWAINFYINIFWIEVCLSNFNSSCCTVLIV